MTWEPDREACEPIKYRVLNDAVIRYILCGNGSEEKLKAFLNSVFVDKGDGLRIEKLTILNPFDPKTFPTDKQASLDMLVEDNRQRKVNLEFQVWDHSFFIERCLFYWSRVYSRRLQEGNKYGGLHPVISVIVTDFQNPQKMDAGLQELTSRIHQSFSIRSDDKPYKLLTTHLKMHFVQLPKVINLETLSEVHPELAHWLAFLGYPNKTTEEFMENIVNNDPNVQAAFEAYQKFHQDPSLRYIAESCETFRRDAEAYADSKEARGEARGRIKGRVEGMAQGRAKGKIETLLLILTKRLGNLPAGLTEKLNGLTDIAEIERLSDIALDVPTLDEFIKNC